MFLAVVFVSHEKLILANVAEFSVNARIAVQAPLLNWIPFN